MSESEYISYPAKQVEPNLLPNQTEKMVQSDRYGELSCWDGNEHWARQCVILSPQVFHIERRVWNYPQCPGGKISLTGSRVFSLML